MAPQDDGPPQERRRPCHPKPVRAPSSSHSSHARRVSDIPPNRSVEELAKRKGVTMGQVSLAWILTKVTAPIVGTTSVEKLADLIGALEVKLSEEEIKYLEEEYKPLAVSGHT